MKIPQNAGLVVSALVLAMSGCGSAQPAAPSPTSSHTTTTTASSTTTTTPTQTVPATAADGTDFAVCGSRSCEVAVSAPVDIRFGGSVPGTLSVTKVSADGVDITVAMDNGGGGNGTLKPGCSAFSFGNGGGSGSFGGPASDCTQPPAAVPGAVTLQLPAMADGAAILRIVTA